MHTKKKVRTLWSYGICMAVISYLSTMLTTAIYLQPDWHRIIV